MNRKELNMSKNTNNNQTVDEKKGKRTGLTILGYVLVIVALLTVLAVERSIVLAEGPAIGVKILPDQASV